MIWVSLFKIQFIIIIIIIIIIIRKQDWTDEDSKWINTAWRSKPRIHVEDKC